ncbi:MAG: deoxyguanosinetriphosphate triphosphohydrolase [Sphingomonadaceae bacterium]
MNLAPYAASPAASRGREFEENQDGIRGPRTAFQRDRDRIIHSIAFRRLRSKTQVFVAPDGDHYRTRLTHSLEVAQIGRVIARALQLDEDLTEALCLAHDIGHPPFGHAGEKALDQAMAPYGGFCHNAHALRVLMRLESPYCDHDGLNLSWEVLEGMAKHNGPVTSPVDVMRELDGAFPLDLESWPSLEAQIAALADDIAYDNHDLDDGLRAGFLAFDALMELPFVADQFHAIERRFPHAPRDRQVRELIRSQIGLMVNDLLEQTRQNISGLTHIDEVRGAGEALAVFSPSMTDQERMLKSFLYDNLYYHPEQQGTAEKAHAVIARLHAGFSQAPEYLPADWQATMPVGNAAITRHIGDYIAGMTDRFAIDQYTVLFQQRPTGLSNV